MEEDLFLGESVLQWKRPAEGQEMHPEFVKCVSRAPGKIFFYRRVRIIHPLVNLPSHDLTYMLEADVNVTCKAWISHEDE